MRLWESCTLSSYFTYSTVYTIWSSDSVAYRRGFCYLPFRKWITFKIDLILDPKVIMLSALSVEIACCSLGYLKSEQQDFMFHMIISFMDSRHVLHHSFTWLKMLYSTKKQHLGHRGLWVAKFSKEMSLQNEIQNLRDGTMLGNLHTIRKQD